MEKQIHHLGELQSFLHAKEAQVLRNDDVTETIFHCLEVLKESDRHGELGIVVSALTEVLNCTSESFELATFKGFYRNYFEMLPKYRSQEETFWNLNSQYKFRFGENKFKNYEAFRGFLSA